MGPSYPKRFTKGKERFHALPFAVISDEESLKRHTNLPGLEIPIQVGSYPDPRMSRIEGRATIYLRAASILHAA